MTKFAQLEMPDCVYNWVNDFFDNHAHCTKCAGLASAVVTIYASVIQGSALGPTVTAAYLHHAGNRVLKFADDTVLVVPDKNAPGGDRSPADVGADHVTCCCRHVAACSTRRVCCQGRIHGRGKGAIAPSPYRRLLAKKDAMPIKSRFYPSQNAPI